MEWFNPIIEQPLRIHDEFAALEERPGSGIEWNEPAIARLPSAMSHRDKDRMEAFERKVRESFGRQTFMTTLGAEIVCAAPGEVTIRMPFNKHFAQQNGFMHAGSIASIMDSACDYAAYSVAPEGCDVLTVEFKVSLLAPAIGDEFLARAKVKRGGKTLTVCAADAFAIRGNQENLIASMLGTVMNLVPNRKPSVSAPGT